MTVRQEMANQSKVTFLESYVTQTAAIGTVKPVKGDAFRVNRGKRGLTLSNPSRQVPFFGMVSEQ